MSLNETFVLSPPQFLFDAQFWRSGFGNVRFDFAVSLQVTGFIGLWRQVVDVCTMFRVKLMFHVAAGLHFIKIVERLQSSHIRTERLGVYNHNNPINRLFFMPSQYRRGKGGDLTIDTFNFFLYYYF